MFPTDLDDLSTTRASAGTDKLSSPDHLVHHARVDDVIEAIETKIGVDNSAVVTTLDYLLCNTASFNPGHRHTFLRPASDSVTALQLFNAAGSPIVTFDTVNGRVGIGAASPTAPLTVYGPGAQADHVIIGQNANYIHSLTTSYSTTATSNYLAFDISSNYQAQQEDVLFLRGDGHVGFSTTSPGSVLSVNGGISAGSYSGTAAPSNGLIISGNVGVGTTSPATRLHTAETKTIAGATADGYAACLTIAPTYTAAGAQTVTRHNYFNLISPTLTNVTLTNAAVFRFDANIGTHKALASAFQTTDSNGDTTDWAVGMIININGTLYKLAGVAV